MALLPHHNIPKKKGTNKMAKLYKFCEYTGNPFPFIIHHNVDIHEVGRILETLKKNKYNHKHELISVDDNGSVILHGYGEIQEFYRKAIEIPKNNDHIINPVLQAEVKTNFLSEINVMNVVNEIQVLASSPGNETQIYELSTVLKYVLKNIEKPAKSLYAVHFKNGIWHHVLELFGTSADEVLDDFENLKVDHTEILKVVLVKGK